MTFPVYSAGGGAVAPYSIYKSLRFRSSASASLSRVPSTTGNQKTWTWSGWIKRGILGVNQGIFEGFASSTNLTSFSWAPTNQLAFQLYILGPYNTVWITNAVFTDPSAWYHVAISLDTTQASQASMVNIYVNGVSQSLAINTYNSPIPQNSDWYVNQAGTTQSIATYTGGSFADDYLAEVNFIDGQALAPTAFGQFDSVTGAWAPIDYTGTYGTNGFYLKFTDTSSVAALGTDFSGNGNTWTVNNVSLTAGSTYDSMTDSPTLTNATVANYATMNPLKANSTVTLTNGNLSISSSSGAYPSFATMVMGQTDGYYAEFNITSIDVGVGPVLGVVDMSINPFVAVDINTTNGVSMNHIGQVVLNGSVVLSGLGSYAPGDTCMVAYKAGKVWFGVNGTWWNSGNPAAGTGQCATLSNPVQGYTFGTNGYTGAQLSANFGQQPFAYTPPAGFLPLNTYNLPTPTIANGRDYFTPTLYTGNGATQTVTNTGFYPDFTWIKDRSSVVDNVITDSVRGATKQLITNSAAVETTNTNGLTAFTTNGFSVGSDAAYNTNTDALVGWQWNAGSGSSVSNTTGTITSTVSANPSAGFSVVTFVANGVAGSTVGHGLNTAPSFVVYKARDNGNDFWSYHIGLTNASYAIQLNTGNAENNTVNFFNSTAPNSSVLTLGYWSTPTGFNNPGNNYVAYCWAPVAGFSAFGKYTGNGSTSGPFVYTGFRPAYVMIKRTDASGINWYVYDTVRQTYNSMDTYLVPNNSLAEQVYFGDSLNILSNGFQITAPGARIGLNENGGTYIYACFAENPFKYANAR